MSSTARAASKWSSSTVVIPACRPTPSATLRPNTWKNGSAASPTSSDRTAQTRMALHLADVRGEVPVREHRGARRARGARREEQHRELGVVALDLGGHAAHRRRGSVDGDRAGEVERALRRRARTAARARCDPRGLCRRAPTPAPAGSAGPRPRRPTARRGTTVTNVDVVVAGDRDPVAGPDPEAGQAPAPPGRRAPGARRTRPSGRPRSAPPRRGSRRPGAGAPTPDSRRDSRSPGVSTPDVTDREISAQVAHGVRPMHQLFQSSVRAKGERAHGEASGSGHAAPHSMPRVAVATRTPSPPFSQIRGSGTWA